MSALLLLLLFLVGTNAENLITLSRSSAEGGQVSLEPSRASIYRHLITEQQNVQGAEAHIQSAFEGLVANIHDVINSNVLSNLQTQVDGVVARAEEAWVDAGKAQRTAEVRTCIDGAETSAQQVAKRAVEKMRGCAEALQQEGERRVREASRLLTHIDSVTRRFVGALETCVKDAEAADWADPPPSAPPPSEAAATTQDPEPTPSSSSSSSSSAATTAVEGGSGSAEEDVATVAPCTKKDADDKTCSCPKCVEEREDEGLAKQKCKGRGKCEKGKNKDQKKEKVNEKEKRKGKKKDGNKNAEEDHVSTEEVKQKKDKQGKKKDSKGKKDKNKDSYEVKGRKSRGLLSFEENPEEVSEPDSTVEDSEDAEPMWPTQGANPEEQYVIQCMQSPLMHQLIEEKTRVYEKLEWMLDRVQEKEQGAQTVCVDEHLNKAELKINAIKNKMANCAERYMREEL